jgi:hypothetical protein
MNPGGISKTLIVLSALAMVISVCSVTYCIVESNDDYDSINYTLYVGLDGIEPYDEADVRADIIAILGNVGQGYTLYEAEGGFDMGDRYITEKTLVYVLNDCDKSLIDSIVDLIIEKYNVGVLVEKQYVKPELYTP